MRLVKPKRRDDETTTDDDEGGMQCSSLPGRVQTTGGSRGSRQQPLAALYLPAQKKMVAITKDPLVLESLSLAEEANQSLSVSRAHHNNTTMEPLLSAAAAYDN